MRDSTLQAVLSSYGLEGLSVRQIEPLVNAGGWSGSRLWRISDAAGRELCLRRWPTEHPKVDRLRVIHGVLAVVAREMPVVACPIPTSDGSTFVEHDGSLWEVTHWKPGRADYHANPNRARLRAAIQTLARFHESSARYKHLRSMPPPALLDRRREFSHHRFGGVAAIERALSLPLHNEIDIRADRLLSLARRGLDSPSALHFLGESLKLDLQPTIRDVHHDHVLFTGDEVTGVIDFGALRVLDTPLTDISRLVGSLVGDDADSRRFAFDAYSELRPLSKSERRLIDLFDETGLVLAALNWLTWLYVERRDMGPIEPIVRRLDELAMRFEARRTR